MTATGGDTGHDRPGAALLIRPDGDVRDIHLPRNDTPATLRLR